MKSNIRKIVFFGVITLVVLFSLFSIFGFKTRWGSTIKHHFKGYDTINWGSDMGNEGEITLSYKELDDDSKQDLERILKKRLSLVGIEENNMLFDDKNKTLTVSFPCSCDKPYFDYNDIATYLTETGEFKVVKTEKDPYNFFMQQKNNEKEDVFLFDNQSIYGAFLKYIERKKRRTDHNVYKPIPEITLDASAEAYQMLMDEYEIAKEKRKDLSETDKDVKRVTKEKNILNKELSVIKEEKEELQSELEEIKQKQSENNEESSESNENAENSESTKTKSEEETQKEEEIKQKEEEIKQKEAELKENEEENKKIEDERKNIIDEINKHKIKITLGKQTLYEDNILGLINDNMKIALTNPRVPDNLYFMAVNILNSEKLPVPLSVMSIEAKTPTLGPDFRYDLTIFAAILLVLSLILIALKFRILAGLAAFNIIGQFSFLLMCFTGFFSFVPGICLNLPASLGIIFSLLLGIFCFYFVAIKTTNRLRNTQNLDLSLKQAYKNELKPLFKINIFAACIFAVLMGIFSPTSGLFPILLTPLNMVLEANPQNSIFLFSYAMFFGIIGNLIFQFFITKVILQSITDFKFFRNVRLYGGKMNETKN